MNLLQKLPIIRSLYRSFDLLSFQKRWRKANRNNATVAMAKFPWGAVTVGEGSYGELHILTYSDVPNQIQIGRYVSIAPNVRFLSHCNHQIDTLTVYPFRSHLFHRQDASDALSKGPIIVEDEAWIGYGCIILDGITIGKGSIVGAGSVVTRDVPPYAIVGGNPAKLIRYRLPEEVVSVLKDFDRSSLTRDIVEQNIDLLYRPLQTAAQTQDLLNQLKKKSLEGSTH